MCGGRSNVNRGVCRHRALVQRLEDRSMRCCSAGCMEDAVEGRKFTPPSDFGGLLSVELVAVLGVSSPSSSSTDTILSMDGVGDSGVRRASASSTSMSFRSKCRRAAYSETGLFLTRNLTFLPAWWNSACLRRRCSSSRSC